MNSYDEVARIADESIKMNEELIAKLKKAEIQIKAQKNLIDIQKEVIDTQSSIIEKQDRVISLSDQEISILKNRKPLWQIFEDYDVDGGFGDAVLTERSCGIVEASEDEIKDFLEYWDKPRVYDHPYDDLCEHKIRAVKIEAIHDVKTFEPYNAETRDWPDDPHAYNLFRGAKWDREKQKWCIEEANGTIIYCGEGEEE